MSSMNYAKHCVFHLKRYPNYNSVFKPFMPCSNIQKLHKLLPVLLAIYLLYLARRASTPWNHHQCL
jgi:hypothetical protein